MKNLIACILLAWMLPTVSYGQQCDCKTCRCDDCDCGFVSVQDKKATMPNPTAVSTTEAGREVKMKWNHIHRMYCPDEPGWVLDVEAGYWYRQQATQQFSGFQGQGGSCGPGGCGQPSGRVGLFGRRR